MIFFYLYRNKETPVMCTADSVVNAAAKYLLSGGNTSLNDAIPTECPRAGQEVSEEFVKAVKSLNRQCSKQRQNKKESPVSGLKPLITLFTTFAAHSHINDTEKYIVHNNTFRNWASLKPRVYLILFSNDSEVRLMAKKSNWDIVVPVNESSSSPPVLKDLFKFATSSFNTPWYGYANGDILFTDDLINTIGNIHETIGSSQRVLITGRRTNVENITKDMNVTEFATLRKFAEANGKLYKTDAEDYFVTSQPFPWNETAPVVVGRPAYDNWIVGHARCGLKSIVIDATETVLAVHQTTRTGGNIEGYKSKTPNFNFDLFKQHKIKTDFITGLTTCCNYKTYRSFCGIIIADERSNLGKGCECVKPK